MITEQTLEERDDEIFLKEALELSNFFARLSMDQDEMLKVKKNTRFQQLRKKYEGQDILGRTLKIAISSYKAHGTMRTAWCAAVDKLEKERRYSYEIENAMKKKIQRLESRRWWQVWV